MPEDVGCDPTTPIPTYPHLFASFSLCGRKLANITMEMTMSLMTGDKLSCSVKGL